MNDIPLLLLIEGPSSEHRTLREVLADARGLLQIERVVSLAHGLARLADRSVSAVLLDLSLPECRDLSGDRRYSNVRARCGDHDPGARG